MQILLLQAIAVQANIAAPHPTAWFIIVNTPQSENHRSRTSQKIYRGTWESQTKKSTLALGTQKPFLDLGLHVLCCPEDHYNSIWMQSVTPVGAEQSLYWFILSFAAQVLLPYTIELDNMCWTGRKTILVHSWASSPTATERILFVPQFLVAWHAVIVHEDWYLLSCVLINVNSAW